MKYAIIELAGRQFKVDEGSVLEVTRQAELTTNVLLYKDDSVTRVGTPYLEDVVVELERIEDKKDSKVVVARYKSKSRYRKTKGHRQPISVIKVKTISTKKTTSEKKTDKADKIEKVEKVDNKESAPKKIKVEKAPTKKVTPKKTVKKESTK